MSQSRDAGTLRAAIEEIVRRDLDAFGIGRVEVIDIKDHDGDPAILVEVHYDDENALPDPRIAAAIVTKINDRLYELGEPRFAYVEHRVPEPEPAYPLAFR